MVRTTRTNALLEISYATFEEISRKLRAAGYDHVFHDDGTVIDMHGIALSPINVSACQRCGDTVLGNKCDCAMADYPICTPRES